MSVRGPAATPASDKRAESAASTPANAGQQPVAATDPNPIPPGVRYRDEIYQAAKAHGVDPLLLAAQGAQESGGPASNSGNNCPIPPQAGFDRDPDNCPVWPASVVIGKTQVRVPVWTGRRDGKPTLIARELRTMK